MISFSFDAKTKSVLIDSVLDKELNINDDEKNIVQIILSFITPPEISESIFLERRSDNYISMFCGKNDFLRFKYSERAKWISLRLPRDLAKNNIENPLFSAQSNKKQQHWRANIKCFDDLYLLKDFIIASCVYIA
ncbi:MAG: hypothetical protein NC548_22210 [Lachnospiraceae bacterium]|nr:hypothetical protein [Lachnospiraceae bacterium]